MVGTPRRSRSVDRVEGKRDGRRSDRTGGSRVKVRVAGALLLVLGVACLVSGGRAFAYATRLAGTQGTFQVLAAESVPINGRSPYTIWHGIFRSTDGRTTDYDATLQDEADGHRLGTRIPVTRADAGTYYTARPNYALGWSCLCLAGGWLAALALPLVCYGRAFLRAHPNCPGWVRAALLFTWGCSFASGAAGLAAVVVA